MNALAALTWGEFMCLLKKKMDHPGPLSAFTKSKKIIARATKLFQVAEMENEKISHILLIEETAMGAPERHAAPGQLLA